MDMLWRLTWVLPFTVLVGGGIILLLRQILGQGKFAPRTLQRMVKQESLIVSDDTRLHLLEVDGRPYVLVESVRSATLHDVPSVSQPAGSRGGLPVPWLRGLRSGVSQ